MLKKTEKTLPDKKKWRLKKTGKKRQKLGRKPRTKKK